jgi:hypothetical protein
VLIEIRGDDCGEGIAFKGKGAIARGPHQMKATLHDAMKLHEKDRQQLRKLRMRPKVVAGSVESAFGKTDFCPEEIAVRRKHGGIPNRSKMASAERGRRRGSPHVRA